MIKVGEACRDSRDVPFAVRQDLDVVVCSDKDVLDVVEGSGVFPLGDFHDVFLGFSQKGVDFIFAGIAV